MRSLLVGVALGLLILSPSCLRQPRERPETRAKEVANAERLLKEEEEHSPHELIREVTKASDETASAKRGKSELRSARGDLDKIMFFDTLEQSREIRVFVRPPESQKEMAIVAEILGHPFSADPVRLEDKVEHSIKRALPELSSYQVEKSTGLREVPYRPDFAIEWRYGGQPYRILISEGSREVLVSGPGIQFYSNLRPERFNEIRSYITDSRKTASPQPHRLANTSQE
jgi:hypothetical protein